MAARLNPVLREFWEARTNERGEPIRYRVLFGGRSSSKSWDAAGMAVWLAANYGIRVLCTRQFQNRIEDSVYTLLKFRIEEFGLKGIFRVLDNKIICTATGSEFVFYGLWRSIDEIKSLEGIDIHWAEEAHLLSEEQWKILDPTIRKEGSQHWIIFNPRLSADFVYKRFVVNPLPGAIVRKINYDENPFLSRTMLSVIEAAKKESHDEYERVYLGVPSDDDDAAVVKRSHLMAAIDAHKALGIEPTGAKRLGFDVADAGEDACANVESHGPLVLWADQWKAREDELLKSCARTWARARDRGLAITYDAIGVGAGAGAKFDELNEKSPIRVRHEKFLAGGAVWEPEAEYGLTRIKNKDFFANIKAQAWWLTADRLRNTYNAVRDGHKFRDDEMIFIDGGMPYLDKLIDEMTTPRRDFDQAGRVKVESKKDLAKREIASPNLADAFIMVTGAQMRKRGFLDAYGK